MGGGKGSDCVRSPTLFDLAAIQKALRVGEWTSSSFEITK